MLPLHPMSFRLRYRSKYLPYGCKNTTPIQIWHKNTHIFTLNSSQCIIFVNHVECPHIYIYVKIRPHIHIYVRALTHITLLIRNIAGMSQGDATYHRDRSEFIISTIWRCQSGKCSTVTLNARAKGKIWGRIYQKIKKKERNELELINKEGKEWVRINQKRSGTDRLESTKNV